MEPPRHNARHNGKFIKIPDGYVSNEYMEYQIKLAVQTNESRWNTKYVDRNEQNETELKIAYTKGSKDTAITIGIALLILWAVIKWLS